MAIISVVIGIFPEQLSRLTELDTNQENPSIDEEMESLRNGEKSTKADFKIADFFVALKRLLKNKLVMFKLISDVFYVHAAIGIMVYYSKFMEVMYNRSAADASIVSGPFEFLTTVCGFYVAAYLIGRIHPSFRILTAASILVGMSYAVAFSLSMILPCDSSSIASQLGSLNFTTNCNQNCSCEAVAFSPVCETELKTTFFSPCHAGCTSWNQTGLQYNGCSCAYLGNDKTSTTPLSDNSLSLHQGACHSDCNAAFYTFIIMFSALTAVGSGINIGKALMDMRYNIHIYIYNYPKIIVFF